MKWEEFFLDPATVWVLIPVTAILLTGMRAIYGQFCRHQERIAMIEHGMYPDEAEAESIE